MLGFFMPLPSSRSPLWNIPNLLSLSRLPLAVGLFVCISHNTWLIGFLLFLVATFTDWLDGWWARRYGPVTDIGRNLDPLTDKVLIGGTFIYLIPVPEAGILPWMVTVIICRELLITGLRGIVEATGVRFGADWFGKLKTGLQCAAIIGVLLLQTCRHNNWLSDTLPSLEVIQHLLLYAMLLATVGSGVQYCVKAARVLKAQR